MTEAFYMLLMFVSPGKLPKPIGVLLCNLEQGEFYWRFREDWCNIADPDDAEVLGCLAEDFAQKVQETGPETFLAFLEDTLSNCLLLTDRNAIPIEEPQKTIDTLFETLVEGR
jgi:hypothetical protein